MKWFYRLCNIVFSFFDHSFSNYKITSTYHHIVKNNTTFKQTCLTASSHLYYSSCSATPESPPSPPPTLEPPSPTSQTSSLPLYLTIIYLPKSQTSLESSCTCSTTICTPILNATRQNKGALSPMPGSASSSESTSAFFTPNLSVLSSAFAGGISTLSASLAETYCTPLSRNSGSSTLFPPLMGFLEPL